MLEIAREVGKKLGFFSSRVLAQSDIGFYRQTDLAAKNPLDTAKRHFRLRWRRRYLSKAALKRKAVGPVTLNIL